MVRAAPWPGGWGPPAEGAPSPCVDDEALDTVIAVGWALAAVATRSLEDLTADVTVAQCRMLLALAGHRSRRVADLAAVLGVCPSTASRMCDRLVAKGLIRRRRNVGDRRVVNVAISRAGQDVVDDFSTAQRDAVRRMLDLTAAEPTPLAIAVRSLVATLARGAEAGGLE